MRHAALRLDGVETVKTTPPEAAVNAAEFDDLLAPAP